MTAFDMNKNDGRTELWLFPVDGGKARRLTAGDKDSEPQWSPDGKWIAFTAKRKDDEEPQVYLIAPDGGEARATDHARHRGAGVALVRRRQAHRLRVVGVAGPQDRQGSRRARSKERKESKVKAHLTERAEYRFWDHWLTDGREPHVFAADVVDRARTRPARRHRARAAAVGTDRRALRHQPGRSRARASPSILRRSRG